MPLYDLVEDRLDFDVTRDLVLNGCMPTWNLKTNRGIRGIAQ